PAAGDEALLAVDDPAVALQHGLGLHARSIRADLGLGDGEGGQLVAPEARGDVALFLLRRAVAVNGDGSERERDRSDRVARVPGRRQLLVYDALGHHAAPVAAVLFGEERPGEPRLAELLEIGPGDGSELLAAGSPLVARLDLLDLLVGGCGAREDLALGERAALAHDLALGRGAERRL